MTDGQNSDVRYSTICLSSIYLCQYTFILMHCHQHCRILCSICLWFICLWWSFLLYTLHNTDMYRNRQNLLNVKVIGQGQFCLLYTVWLDGASHCGVERVRGTLYGPAQVRSGSRCQGTVCRDAATPSRPAGTRERLQDTSQFALRR